MKTNGNNEMKANVASGISSAIGTAAGVVTGSLITEEIHTSEVIEEAIVEPIVEGSEPVVTNVVTDPEIITQEIQVVHSEPEQPVVPTVLEPQEPQVQVMAYETVIAGDGSKTDLALVSMDGLDVILADEDQDGRADIAIADLNGNSVLDEGEVADVTEYGIQMQPLKDAFNEMDNGLMAQNTDIDYTNDANVDAYYA